MKKISLLMLLVMIFPMCTFGGQREVYAAAPERVRSAEPAYAPPAAEPDAAYSINITSYQWSNFAGKFVELPMKATYQIEYTTNVPNPSVTFSSEDPNVVSVSQKGLITVKQVQDMSVKITVSVLCPDGTTASDKLSVLADFIDVTDSSAYYYHPVYFALDRGITSGFTDSDGNQTGYFKPDESCTRGQIVTFLYRAFGNDFPVDTSGVSDFKDVKKKTFYYDAVKWAVALGVTTGYTGKNGKPTGKFGPDDVCTRAQVVTFLYRLLGETIAVDTSGVSDFKDVKEGSYYYDAVRWAVAARITTGYAGSSKFGPNDKCTRGQVVTFIYRCFP